MKKTIAQHSERDNRHKAEEAPKGAVPHYLLDREQVRHVTRAVSGERGGVGRAAARAGFAHRSGGFGWQTLRLRFCALLLPRVVED